jgi:hypothetical protein
MHFNFPKLKVDVFKHIQQIVTRKLPMFKRNNNNSSTMGKELKPFAGTLLYLMEKMQKNLRKLDSSNGILQNRRKKRGAKMEMWKDFWKCVGNILLCIFIILLFTVIFLALAFPPVLAVILACIFMVIGWVCSRGGGCYVVVM